MGEMKTAFVFILTAAFLHLPTTAYPYGQVDRNQLWSKLPKDITEEIDSFASTLVNCSTVIGMNVAVVQNGQTVFSNSYGVVDLESQKPVTSRTLYSIGSITKSITATLLGKILQEKGLTWDTKVMDILSDKEFQFIDPMLTCQVTLKDIAAHRTGIPSRNYAVFQDITRKQLAGNIRFSQKQNQFRDGFTYNNNLYGVLAYIIEKLSGESYEELVRKEIFIPLKMNSSMFMHQMDLSDENLAQPYKVDPLDDNRPRPVSKRLTMAVDKVGAGAGSVISTAEDMAQYMKLHMGRGVVDGVRVLPADVVAETHGQLTIFPNNDNGITRPDFPATYAITSYGFGSSTGSYKGYKITKSAGGLLGYGSLAAYLSDESFGVYAQGVAANEIEWSVQRRLLFMFIADLLLGEIPWLNESTICTFPEPWMNKTTSELNKRSGKQPNSHQKKDDSDNDGSDHSKSSFSLKVDDVSKYLGQYGNFQYGNITVASHESGSLILSYGVGAWALIPTADNVFLGVPGDSSFPMYIPGIEFRKLDISTGLLDELLIAFVETDRNVFQRGLKLSDAPPFEPLNCEYYFSHSGTMQQSSISPTVLFLILTFTFIF